MQKADSSRPAPTENAVDQRSLQYFVCLAIRSAIWLVASLFAAALALEMVLALVHYGEEEFLRIDPVLGLVHMENKEITWRVEGFSHGRINSSGLLDRERPLTKPPGIFRIAVFGDSFTEGMQVSKENRFTSLLEDKLNSKGPQKFEVLNCGMSGYGTGQEYLLYLTKIRTFRPDVVILCVNEWDVDKNTAFPDRPLFWLADSGQLQISWADFDNWRNSNSAKRYTLCEWARKNSRVWGVLQQIYSGLTMNPWLQKHFWYLCGPLDAVRQVGSNVMDIVMPPTSIDERNIEDKRRLLCESARLEKTNNRAEYLATSFDGTRTKSGKSPAIINKQWQTTTATVAQFATACWREHCALVLVVLPVKGQKDALQERFQSLAYLPGSKSIPLVNLIPAFINDHETSSSPLFLRAHFCERGHEIVADSVFHFLKQNHLTEADGRRVYFIDR